MRRAVAAVFLAALACTPLRAQAPPADPRAAAQESLLRADAQWADTTARAGLVMGFASALADDAVYLHPGADAMRGREAIRAFLAAQPATAGTVLRWQALRSAVSGDRASGYTAGVSHVVVSGPDGAPVSRFGRYITFWRRGADGRWLAVATMHARPPSRLPLQLPAGWRRATPDTARGGAATAMERADRAFAALAAVRGAGPAFVAFAAPDVLNIGGQVVAGPAEVGAQFEGDTGHWAWGPILSGASADGELGYTVGEAAIAGAGPDGAPQTSYSKYLTIWRRQPDGTYKYVTDGGNGRPAPTP